jgi:hypothetical protein
MEQKAQLWLVRGMGTQLILPLNVLHQYLDLLQHLKLILQHLVQNVSLVVAARFQHIPGRAIYSCWISALIDISRLFGPVGGVLWYI